MDSLIYEQNLINVSKFSFCPTVPLTLIQSEISQDFIKYKMIFFTIALLRCTLHNIHLFLLYKT